MTKDDFDNEIEKFIVNYAGDFAPTDFAPSYAEVAAKARELMMSEVDLFKRARDKREKEHKEFVMSIENIDVHLDSAKLRAELALAVEALTVVAACSHEAGIKATASAMLDKLGADK